MSESTIMSLMDRYIETAKTQLLQDGLISSVLFFFYPDTYSNKDTPGVRVEPVGFHITSDHILQEMQQTANDKVRKERDLLAIGVIQDIFYKKAPKEETMPISQDPESLTAIHACVYFPVKPRVEKTVFYKDFGDKCSELDEDLNGVTLHNVGFVGQVWNSKDNPSSVLFLDPFEAVAFP